VKPVAFLFDNDGVLIDSSELHWQSWQLMMREIPALKMDKEAFIHGFGKRNDLILEEIVPHVPKEIRKQWAERKEALFRECARGKVALLSGMEHFLQQVVAAQIPHIIASSTPVENLEMYIKTTVLGRYFQQYISGEEVAHGKPAPDVFIAAAQRLNFSPSQCVVFEDAPAGIKAGKAAGSFVVALATTHTKEQLKDYHLIYPSPRELNLQEILHGFNAWSK